MFEHYNSNTMNRTLFCLEIILSFCVVCGVTDYISDTTYPSDGTFTYCDGSDWVPYKDEKCFKIIKNWVNRDQAEIICNQEYFFRTDAVVPTLASIKSAAEQEYLTKFVFDTSGVDTNVWIGAKRRPEDGNQFVWNDGSVIKSGNWAEGCPTEESRRDCVEMQSELSKQYSNMSHLNQRAFNGKWKDVGCNIGNWVLCQKLQTWSLLHFQKTFLDTRKELQDSLKDVTNQLNDTMNQLDNTKNELTTTKNDLTTTQNDLINTKIELATTKNDLINTNNQLTTTKNDLINTNNQLTTTKNDLINTNNQLTTTKNDLINTNNEQTTTKNELTSTKNDLEVLQKNPIPIGFIYVQLPSQPEPWSLWGSLDWIEITSEYAGLFFRVLGGGSAHFGEMQEADAPRIQKVQSMWDIDTSIKTINVSTGDWSNSIETSRPQYSSPPMGLRFYVPNVEVRPRNKAIRIWKRTN